MEEFVGKQQIFDLLNTKGIPFEKLEHAAVYTMEEMDEIGVTGRGTVCKNLFVRDGKGKRHFLICVPEQTRVDLKTLARQLESSKFSFASAERLEKYLRVEQGCVSPLGVLNDESKSVTVVFDRALENDPAVGVHPNDNTATVWLRFADLKRVIEEHGNPVALVDFAE